MGWGCPPRDPLRARNPFTSLGSELGDHFRTKTHPHAAIYRAGEDSCRRVTRWVKARSGGDTAHMRDDGKTRLCPRRASFSPSLLPSLPPPGISCALPQAPLSLLLSHPLPLSHLTPSGAGGGGGKVPQGGIQAGKAIPASPPNPDATGQATALAENHKHPPAAPSQPSLHPPLATTHTHAEQKKIK